MLSWAYLVVAILLEVCGTTCMKISEGFTRIVPSVLMFVFYLASLAVLNLALKQIPVSVTYAVWAGVGTAVIAVIGVGWFGEPMNAMKAGSIGLIILGVVGLNLAGGAH